MNGSSLKTFVCCGPDIATLSIGAEPAARTLSLSSPLPISIRPRALNALDSTPEDLPEAARPTGPLAHRIPPGPVLTRGGSRPSLMASDATESPIVSPEAAM
ncbi:MAG: hypothetical protein QGG42_15975 [Phycisphaerae bacterium]|nr:hypothetical protein [Phycisphaerae bacterium]